MPTTASRVSDLKSSSVGPGGVSLVGFMVIKRRGPPAWGWRRGSPRLKMYSEVREGGIIRATADLLGGEEDDEGG
eukprot:CAMPEP_0118662946 /NCGR_PEP_ID=MMETSP0785-20121206/17119_1 /TAXON_ID=91992 /ORGANISM="Bolidomonas pacifica, Strain CCMP 1866" /LENGTH=74 /DNA_ID=CAMNT_0006556557 /DNA_START=21 /DNA_END=245 /DNA_ORIENTATION=-